VAFDTYLRQFGLTLKSLHEYSGQSKQTLGNWYKKKPELIKALVKAYKYDELIEQAKCF
jgi:phage-related tail protein